MVFGSTTTQVVEEANIRGLDIDKTVKGFALVEYIFKSAVTVSSISADSIRWYQETAADPTANTALGLKVANKATYALPFTLEHSWTRNTSYVKEYMAEGTISEMDIMSADIDVLARTLLRLTRAVVKQVDTDIYNVITENQSASNINTVASTAAWDAASGQDPIEDILDAMRTIEQNNYSTSNLEIWLSPLDKKNLLTWLITTKGASIPRFASDKVESGVIMEFLGAKLRVSPNVVADSAVVLNPKQACTFKQHTDTTSRIIEEPGISKKIRVWERGIALLTDPKAVCLITNTQTA